MSRDSIYLNPCSLSLQLRRSHFSGKASLSFADTASKFNHWVYTEKTEREVVEDCLMFMESSKSRFIEFCPAQQQFAVSEAIEFQHLSALTLKNDLQRLCSFQNNKRFLQSELEANERAESLVIREFCSVCRRYFNLYQREVSFLIVVFNTQNGT